MEKALGFLLLAGGAAAAYFILIGRFPPGQATASTSSSTAKTGDGGRSLQSYVLGLPHLSAHTGDRAASRGGMR